ncbi:MAG: exonuclease SbcCD subunit D [Lachnospiraceae bacterium]|nr:exonuclease SbcCD subunit D [Lachnospiraceae bacterium]
MRFLHLSDLHIGKRVNEFSMIEEQKYILNQILNVIDDERVESVLIAGDIYDKSVPSAEAVLIFDEFLTNLADRNLTVFVISGNHDSPERIAFGNRLMKECCVYMSPVFNGDIRPITLKDEYGSVNIYMLPFIKPVNVKKVYPDAEADSYSDAVKFVIDKMDVNKSERNIIVAHQLVTGAGRCDSEDISIGGMDNVDASVFEPFDYVALGHIHRPQSISRDTLRYSGTPLKYSFSEMNHNKSLTIVDMLEKGNISIDTSHILVPEHDMREIRGRYMEITDRNFYIGTNIEDYLHIILEDEEDIPDVLGRLRSIYPNIMKLDYDNLRTRTNNDIDSASDLEEKTPMQLFEEFFRLQNNADMNSRQRELIEGIIEDIF